MRLLSMIGTAALALTIVVPAYAQQEQHEQKDEEKGKSAQEEKKAQPEKSVKREEKSEKPQEKNAQQDNRQPENKNAQQHSEQHSQQPEPARQAHNNNRIPAERYRANFGREHSFHVSRDDYSRDRRFQYGGYWFGFVDPWPTNWLYTQDVFVVEIDGMYYLCNPSYPGVNVAINVNL